MNRVVTCVLAGAMALTLQSAAAWAQDDEAATAEVSKPVPLAEVDPGQTMDLLAEGKNGEVLGVVFDVVLDDSGKAKTIVVELFEDEEVGPPPGDEAVPPDAEEDVVAEDKVKDEPEALPADGEEAEGTEEPVMVGKLVGLSPKGAMVGDDVVSLPDVTAAQAKKMAEFNYTPGMKSVGHPDGYPAE